MTAGPVSRILSAGLHRQDDHSSRRRVNPPLQRPTRRFDAPSRHVPILRPAFSPFCLAPCGVYHAPLITERAVRSYRTFSPLPASRKKQAVCSLWHWPSVRLEPDVPDVIRHTALRSSDFPLLASRRCGKRPPGPATYICIILESCSASLQLGSNRNCTQ